MAKTKFYNLKNILAKNCQYNIIFGERSNGKTYAVLKHGIEQYAKTGHKMAIIRRTREDFTGAKGASMFDALIANGEISKLSGGLYNSVYYAGGRWYFQNIETGEDGKEVITKDDKPFCFAFSISTAEHYKGNSYPEIYTILFDEFLTRSVYLGDEFVLFMNLLSTIIRQRDGVKIFMLGNTVNRYCPYFREMGLKHILKMQPGDIAVYEYGKTALKVAVEYTNPNRDGKASDVYFAFDNPKLRMITAGAWEIAIYPHLPIKYRPADILFTYFIEFEDQLLQCEIISIEDKNFTFVHPKTTEIKNPKTDLVFSQSYNPSPNYRRFINKPIDRLGSKILEHYKQDKIYFSDNETGEIMRNYLLWCGIKGIS